MMCVSKAGHNTWLVVVNEVNTWRHALTLRLEVALKQERVKYHKLRFGVEPNSNELKLPTTTSSNNEQNGKHY